MSVVAEYVDSNTPFDEDEPLVFDRIVADPNVLGGKPAIRGHRISVQFVLERIASGESVDTFARLYQLDRDDVVQALRFAASRMTSDVIVDVVCPS